VLESKQTDDLPDMGMVFGRITEEMPAYTVLHKAASYEVRKYAPSVVAECSYGSGGWGSGNDSSPFGALARYIGVFGNPQNVQSGSSFGVKASEAIPMTAPVLVSPPSQKIAMTAPVLVSDTHTMAFVLPASKYKAVEEAPKPTDPRVIVRLLPERVQAARTFSWNFTPHAAKAQLELLLTDLAKDDWTLVKSPDGSAEWQAAGYNPPFALPFLKRNEVLVSVLQKE